MAAALPTYTMANYILPKSICSQMDSRMMRFWWGFSDSQHHIGLKSWASLCRPKVEGGLGLKLMESHNKALIAKLGWQIQTNLEKPWVQIIHAKYLKGSFVWEAKASNGDSWFWKGITRVASILKSASCFQIGSGTQVRMWHDQWLPLPTPHCPLPRLTSILTDEETMVDSLIMPFSRAWNTTLIRYLFVEEDAEAILNLHVPRNSQADTLIWAPEIHGRLSLKSAHSLITPLAHSLSILPEEEWKLLWRIPMQDRLKLFLWKVVWNCLPSKAKMDRFSNRPEEESYCVFCHQHVESLIHIFFECPVAQIMWREAPWPIITSQIPFF